VDVGEERLAGVGLRAFQEPQGGQISESSSEAAVTQRSYRLGDVQPIGHACQLTRPPMPSPPQPSAVWDRQVHSVSSDLTGTVSGLTGDSCGLTSISFH
jgi:hypothetical protein